MYVKCDYLFVDRTFSSRSFNLIVRRGTPCWCTKKPTHISKVNKQNAVDSKKGTAAKENEQKKRIIIEINSARGKKMLW